MLQASFMKGLFILLNTRFLRQNTNPSPPLPAQVTIGTGNFHSQGSTYLLPSSSLNSLMGSWEEILPKSPLALWVPASARAGICWVDCLVGSVCTWQWSIEKWPVGRGILAPLDLSLICSLTIMQGGKVTLSRQWFQEKEQKRAQPLLLELL